MDYHLSTKNISMWLQNLSADSLTDSQKARIEERPSETGREQVAQEGASNIVSQNKRGPAALEGTDARNNNEEVSGLVLQYCIRRQGYRTWQSFQPL
jgi:hypothetical protein